uniref:BPTI/Kunitz inhibitor domain-containing protein n=1 Tax=Ixodes ricinus TaxID=34613 RepID=V5H9U3_IXORI
MSGIKLILLFSHICIVYAVGDDVGGIDQKPILQEKNEPGIPENRGASSKAGTTKCNTTKTTCPPRPTKWHFNGLVGRCERDTRSFCGGTENTFVNFKECQEKCEEAEIVTLEDCRMALDRGICEPKKRGRPKKGVFRWYFNSTDSVCRMFMWCRCCGNRNNFPTRQDCMTCKTGARLKSAGSSAHLIIAPRPIRLRQ